MRRTPTIIEAALPRITGAIKSRRRIFVFTACSALAVFSSGCEKSPPPPGPGPSPGASAAAPSPPGAKLVLPSPKPEHAHLKGRILRGSTPVAGLKVEVCTTPQCGNILQEKTDANGEYAFRDIEPGTYSLLTIYGPGDASQQIWPKGADHPIAAGAVVTADVALK